MSFGTKYRHEFWRSHKPWAPFMCFFLWAVRVAYAKAVDSGEDPEEAAADICA